MRILITAWPGYGHLLPMLPLARAARAAGHQVVIATGSDLVGQAERRGFATWPVGPTQAEVYARFPDVSLLPPEQRPAAELTAAFVEPAGERATELVPRALGWRPHLVVSELMELSGAIVAARCGARHVVHGVGLVGPGLWARVPAYAELTSRWRLTESEPAAFLDICPRSLSGGDDRLGWPVRPLRPASGDPGSGARLPAALDALPFEDTVHLTLGTVFHQAPGVLKAAVVGLAELPVNVVVVTGPDVDPGLLGSQPPNVLVDRYLPHALLLGRCCAVISHGGAGTLLAAFRHGLPQLLLPQGADQFDNAEAAVHTGAALRLDPPVDAEAVAATTRRLLSAPGYAEAARRLQAEIEAMPTAEAALAELLLDELVAG